MEETFPGKSVTLGVWAMKEGVMTGEERGLVQVRGDEISSQQLFHQILAFLHILQYLELESNRFQGSDEKSKP